MIKKESTLVPDEKNVTEISKSQNSTEIEKPELFTLERNTMLSRRKALQDFYDLNSDVIKEHVKISSKDEKNDQINDILITYNSENKKVFLDLIKNKSIDELCMLKKDITKALNLQFLEKKTIFYENYHELIKLNEVLKHFSKIGTMNESVIEKTFNIKENYYKKKKDHAIEILEDLSSFISDQSKIIHETLDYILDNNYNQKNDDFV